jgi:hypothetical protein
MSAGWAAIEDVLGRKRVSAFGQLNDAEKDFIPLNEWGNAVGVARVWLATYAATLVARFWLHSILPLMLIGLPRLYGAWRHVLTGRLLRTSHIAVHRSPRAGGGLPALEKQGLAPRLRCAANWAGPRHELPELAENRNSRLEVRSGS